MNAKEHIDDKLIRYLLGECDAEESREVERWEPRLRLIEQANYMRFFRSRWGFLFGQVLGRMPWLCYKFSSLLGYEIKAGDSLS